MRWFAFCATLAVAAGVGGGTVLAGVPSGGSGAELVMSGLAGPIGIETDNRARVWVSEMGPPASPGNGSISWFYMDQADSGRNTFISGYPVAINPETGEAAGVAHIDIDSNGNLLLAAGGPPVHPMLGGVVRYDITPSAVEGQSYAPDGAVMLEIQTTAGYALAMENVNDTNAYSVAEDPDGNLYVADAGANAIIKIATDGSLSTFATFPQSNINVQAVPTRIISVENDGAPDSTAFIVVELTGVPFFQNESRIWGLTNDGTTEVLVEGLSTIVDCELDSDGSLLVCSAGSFDFGTGIFLPGTGAIQRVELDTGTITTLMSGLWLPTGVEVIGDDIYFCTFYEGSMYRFNRDTWPEYCREDVDESGDVDIDDLLYLIEAWGSADCQVSP